LEIDRCSQAGPRPDTLSALRFLHPELLHVEDPRPFLDEAAKIAARYGGGWLICETLATGLAHGHDLWFGTERNVGRVLATAASKLGIAVHVTT
jgi:hypothetical protein